MRQSSILQLAAVLVLTHVLASGQEVRIVGADGRSATLTAGVIASLPHLSAALKPEHGPAGRYEGPSLSTILQAAKAWTGGPLRGGALAQVVVVTAADGYRVALAAGEIDPSIRAAPVILADRVDGKPLTASEGPFRLVVGGDLRPARSARAVTIIELRPLAPER